MARVVLCLFSGFWLLLCVAAIGQQLPAVSAVNGKLEFDAGALSLPSPGFVGRAAGTLTVPLGAQFGLQVDLSAATAPGFSTSAALHLFTRDPQSYLFGGTLGVVRTPGAVVMAAGPEAEIYFDQWTLEAWGGVTYVRPTAGADRIAPFARADVAYYPDDNWRLSLGLSHVDGYGAVHFGSEYLLEDLSWPMALTAEARVGQDGAIRALGGIRFYFGAPTKSLIRRHREDDPVDRGATLYGALGGRTIGNESHPGPEGTSATAGEDDPVQENPIHDCPVPTDSWNESSGACERSPIL